MKQEPGWLPAARWVLFAALIINAVVLVVYFRVQEVRLKYRISRLQEELDRQEELARGLSRDLLRSAHRDALRDRARDLGLDEPRE